READGTALPPQAISSGKRAFEAPQLVADATGDAALVWNEPRLIYSDQVSPSPYSVSDINLISERLAGGAFGEPAAVPGAESEAYDPKVAMSGDGLVTVAFPAWSYVGRVVAGQVGQPLTPVRSFGLNNIPVSAELVSNAAGKTLLAWVTADVSHAVTTFRNGSGEFGRVEDLRPGCEHADSVTTKLNEAGEAAALIMDHGAPYVTTLTDPTVRGHQECAWSTVYTDDPDANVHVEGPRTMIHPPEVAELRLARLAVPGDGAGRQTVYAAVDCPGHCDFRLTVSRKSRRGRVLASASQRFSSRTLRRLRASVAVPVVPKNRRKRAMKRLFIRIDGRDRHWRPTTVKRQVQLR
ncbi:MAG: hypothetical protein QOJ14_2163, partial [Thermoleophilaceae bacterium]|nr:hypothetical protein [Thermoleophilaceae bacterium]